MREDKVEGWRYWDDLQVTRQGMNAELPLIRSDSVCRQITNLLYGIYTPSTGVGGALLMGTKENCEGALNFYKDEKKK